MPRKTSQQQFRIKPLCAALLLAFAAQSAQANPLGSAVVNGQASFATSGNTLTVTNTPGTIIHWQDFSIGANEITRFAQQSAASTVLNRVTSNIPSNILGTLQSNGRVFLVNPNGVLFGAGATIDVAGLVATTLNLSSADFLAGRYNFTQIPGAANISNAGNLTAQNGGQIFLIAPNVENTGVIIAPNGEILLAAGHSVELVNSNDPNLRVNITAPAGDSTNVGQLIASAGNLGLFGAVVKNTGKVSADSATLQGGKVVFRASQRVDAGGTISASGNGGGEIKVLADMQSGTVNVSGTLGASALSNGNGGYIEILGNLVNLTGTATLDASGATNGGTILIGGDKQGGNPNIQNAQNTFVDSGVTIKADGFIPSPSGGWLGWGNGGKIIVWANDNALVYGSISARGGINGGNGGFIETSGHYLDVAGIKIDTTALNGQAGTWLLDPWNVTITATADAGGAFVAGPPDTWTPSATGSTITAATIVAALNGGTSVTINTAGGGGGEAGNITVSAPVSAAVTGAGTTLTFNADNNIAINQPITSTGTALNLLLNYGAAGSATLTSTLALAGGNLDVQKAGVAGVGTLTSSSGTLNNVTIGSSMTESGSLTISNNFLLADAVNFDTGASAIDFNSAASTIGLAVGATSATITKAGGAMRANLVNNSGVVTIASGVTVRGYGTFNNWYAGGSWVNNGIINGNVAGQTFTINPTNFTNNGTLQATAGTLNANPTNLTLGTGNTLQAAGGTLTINPTNAWSNAAGNTDVTAGTLNLGSAFTLAGLGNYTRSGGTVNITGTLDMLNSVTPFDLASTGQLGTGGLGTLSGTLSNGTLTGTALTSSSGTLNNVTIGSSMTESGSLTISNNFLLADAVNFDTGASAIDFNSAASTIGLAVGATSATITKAGGAMRANLVNNSGVVTIASGVTVRGYGTFNNWYAGGSWVNNGIINGNVAGQTLSINPTNFTNNGTLQATAGTLNANPTNLTLGTGNTLQAAGGTLTINPTNAWSNAAGNTDVTAGTLNLGSAFTLAGLGNYTRSGGTVNITGTLDMLNSVTPFDLASTGQLGTGGLGTLSGTLSNGTLTGTALTSSSGTLNNVTIGSSMTESGSLTISNNFLLADAVNFDTGASAIDFNSAASTIGLAVGATSATITKAGGAMRANLVNNSGVVTIASGVTVRGYGTFNNWYAGGSWVNNGIINGNVAGQTFTINPTNFTNNGTLQATAGTLNANPTTFNNNGAITYAAGTTGTLNPTTFNNAGSLTSSATTLNLTPTNYTKTGTDFITLNAGTLTLSGAVSTDNLANANYTRVAGTTLNLGAGTFDLGGGTLDVDTGVWGGVLGAFSGTLANGTITGTALTSSSGTLNNVTIGSSMTESGALYITQDLLLADGINFNTGNSTFYFNGAAANVGLAAGASSATLAKADGAMYANMVNNSGVVTIASGVTVRGYGTFNNWYAGGSWVNNGIINGNVAGQTLSINPTNFTNNGTLDTTAGTLTVSASNFTQSGSIEIASGATFSRTAGFTNAGIITGAGTLNLGSATLTNNGIVAPGVASGDSTGTLVIAGNLLMGAGGQLNMEVNSSVAGDYDLLRVTGTATLTNGTLNISGVGTTNDLTLLTTSAGLGGTAFFTINGGGVLASPQYLAKSLMFSNTNLTGMIVWDGGAGTTAWATAGNWSNNAAPTAASNLYIGANAGSISVSSGAQAANALTCNADLVISGGSLALEGASTLTSLTLSGGTLSGAGAVSVSNGLTWTGGTINRIGSTTIGGTSDWSLGTLNGGTLTNLGTLSITGTTGDPFISGATAVLENAGTLIYDKTGGNLRINANGILTNLAGGTVDLRSDRSILDYFGGGNINNYGTFTKTAGVSTTIATNVRFNSFDSSGFNVPVGEVLLSGGGSFTGTSTGGWSGAGTPTVASGPIINEGSWTGGGSLAGTWQWTAADLTSGTLTNTGTLWITGASGDPFISGATAVLENSGTVIYDKTAFNLRINNSGAFTNLFGGTVDLRSDQSILDYFGGGNINNYGTFTKTAGASTTIATNIIFNSLGGSTFSVPTGQVLLNGGGSFAGTATGGTTDIGPTITGGNWSAAVDAAISGNWQWTAGTFNSGTLTNSGTLWITGATGDPFISGATALLQNSGTVIYDKTGGFWRINANGTFANLAGGTVDLRSDQSILDYFGGGNINNYGTFTKTAGASTTIATNIIFNSFGGSTFRVPVGTVLLDGGGQFTGTATGGTTDNGPTLYGGNWSAGTGGALAGNWQWQSGTFNSGTLTNTGTLRITGATGDAFVSSPSAVLENSGTVIYDKTGTGYWRIAGNGGVFTNLAGGTVDMQSDRGIYGYFGTGIINNYGIFTKTAGVSTTIGTEVAFNSFGGSTFRVPVGTVLLDGGGQFTGTATGGTTDNGPTLYGGNWSAGTGGALAGNWQWQSGTFNSGTLTNTGTLRITGATGDAFVSSPSAVLENSGTVIYDKTGTGYWRIAGNGGVFTNLAGGTVDMQSDRGIYGYFGTGIINNYGIFTKTAGVSTTIGTEVAFNNTGTISVQTGSLSIPTLATNAGTIQVGAGTTFTKVGAFTNNGTLAGSGTIDIGAANTLTNNGIIAPGIAIADTTGTLSITGNLVMGAGSNLNMDINSSAVGDYDVLNVSGTANLTNGTLNLSGTGGAGSYSIVNATGGLGGTTFATINSGTFIQTPTYAATSLTLAVTGNTLAVIYWDGGAGNSNWESAFNWSTDVLPTLTDNLYISATYGTVSVSTGAQYGNALTCDANLAISGGSLTLAGTSAINGALTLSGGTLGGTGALTVTGAFDITGTSTLTGAGLLTTQGATTVSVTAVNGYVNLINGKNWTNQGTLTVGGDDFIYFGYTSGGANTLTNAVGGILNLSSSYATPLNLTGGWGGTATINNAGILNQAAAGTHNISSTAFNNLTTGVVNVNAGTLRLGVGGTDAGIYNVSAGTTLDFFSGTRNLDAGSNITGAGTLGISGGTVNVNNLLGISTSGTALNVSSGALNINTALTASALTLSGGTLGGTGALTVTGAFDITGTSTLTGAGLLTTQGATTVSMTAVNGYVNLINGKNWTNQGTLTVGGDDFIYFGYTSGGANTLTNAVGGILNLSSSYATPLNLTGGWGGTATINNAGILNQAAAGTHNISSTAFNNLTTGVVNVNAGTLRLGVGGTDAGIYNVSAGTTLDFFSGTRNLDAGSNITGAGTLGISGGTVNVNNLLGISTSGTALNVSSGALNINTALTASALTLSGGTLGGTGALTVTGAFDITGTSTLTGAGLLTTQGATTVSMTAVNGYVNLINGKNWTNQGTLTVGGDDFIYFGYTSGGANTLTNAVGGILNLSSSYATPLNLTGGWGGTATINNAGILNQAAAGTHNISSTAFNNLTTGVVNVNAGTLRLGVGGTDAGIYNVSAGTTLDFFSGTRNLDAGSNITGAGTLGISGGTVNVNNLLGISTSGTALNVSSGALNINTALTASALTLSGGTLGGTGALTVTGAFDITGTSTLTGAGLLTTQGATTVSMTAVNGYVNLINGKNWTNQGTLTVGGDDFIYFGYTSGGANTLTNAVGGILNLSSSYATPLNLTGGWGGTATINNAGILNQAAAGTHNISSTAFNNLTTGVVNVNAGTLGIGGTFATNAGVIETASGATFQKTGNWINTGTLRGAGTIDIGAANTLTNNGIIAPAGSGSTGTLNITGNLNLAGGTVQIDLGGTGAGQSDKIAVTGNVTLGGTLNSVLIGGYAPVNTDAIPFLTMTGTAVGTFATNSLPTGFSAAYNMAAGEGARLIYASAGDRVFNNSLNNLDWGSAANWTGGLPGSADTALISGTFAVTHAYGTDTVAALTINALNSLDVSGGSLAISGATNIGGALSVSGGTLSLNGASSIAALSVNSGTLNGTGDLTVTNSFSRTGATIGSTFTGLSITQSSGDLSPGTWAVNGPISLTTNAGGSIIFGTATLQSSGAITLNSTSGSIDASLLDTDYVNITGSSVTLAGNWIDLGHSVGNGNVHATAGNILITAASAFGGCSATSCYQGNLIADAGNITINSNAYTSIRGNISASGNVTIVDTSTTDPTRMIRVKNVTAGGAIVLNSASIIQHDPALGGLLSAPVISLTAVDGIGFLGNPLFTGSSGAGLTATNTATNDIVITSTAPNFTVGTGGATLSNVSTAGYVIGASGDITWAGVMGVTGSSLTLQAVNNIIFSTGSAIIAGAAPLNVVLNADSDGVGGGGIYLDTASSITSNGGNIWMGGGGANTRAIGNGTVTGGITFNSGITVLGNITAGAGNVTMRGEGTTGSVPADGVALLGGTLTSNGVVMIDGVAQAVSYPSYVAGVHFANSGTRLSTATGTVTVTGTNLIGGYSPRAQGVTIENATLETTGAGTLTLNGSTHTTTVDTNWGVGIVGGTVRTTASSGGGAVTLNGAAPIGDGAVVLAGGYVTSSSGEIRMLSSLTGGIGILGSSVVGGASSGNILMKVSAPSAIIDLLSGSSINAGSSALTISAAGGSVNVNTPVVAGALRLLGSGTFSFSNAANDVGTLAANISSALNYTDINALTISSVTSFDGTGTTPTAGLTATGAINLAILSGDLTVAQNIATTDTTTAAILLNAGQTAAAGTATGGNIVIGGAPAISTGAGGRATLMTGSITGSIGLTALIGSGSGNFRYNSDEAATNYTAVLGAGKYAIYREQPMLTITANSPAAINYGDITPSYTILVSGQNGDTAVQALSTPATVADDGAVSSSGKLTAASHTLAPSGAVGQLGYALNYVNGSLTVTPALLNITGITSANKVYDATTAATLTGTAAIAVLGTDVVTLMGTGSGTFADKNVGAAKPVTVASYSISGTDAGNYTLAQPAGLTANITTASLTVTAVGVNKTVDGTTAAAVLFADNRIAGDVLNVTGAAAFADPNIGVAKPVTVTGITIAGLDAPNYALSNTTAGCVASINAAPPATAAPQPVLNFIAMASIPPTMGFMPLPSPAMDITPPPPPASNDAPASQIAADVVVATQPEPAAAPQAMPVCR